ncbi:MAG: hypothetical protein LAN61_01860 [Acidobacteriia bacterium]|nr:hypothetical protein [Terriglobia bacterium]
MANPKKSRILDELRQRFGDVRKLKGSESLFVIGDEAARVYFRYSKVHAGGRTFFGLREVDLRQLEGHNSFLCFLLNDGSPPVFVPYLDFEEVFANAQPAKDGQYKVQLTNQANALELYVARQGRFNVEAYVGFETLERSLEAEKLREASSLSHSQVQTLLAGIGHAKGYEVFVPESDIGKLDWSLTKDFPLRRHLPEGFDQVRGILREIDVVWVANGRNKIEGLYEVEHSTPVYSGLLRFNDILLTDPRVSRFSIVSNDVRRDLFSRQLFRPTFKKSGLAELCSFLEYANVFAWHRRLLKGDSHDAANP